MTLCTNFVIFVSFFVSAQSYRQERTVTTTIDKDFRQNVVHHVKIPVNIYYESLCPASVEFFWSQLKPVLQKIPSYVDVQLIPYGHATTTKRHGRYTFRCQHGPAECYGNKLQACVLHHVQDSTQAGLINVCLMQDVYNQAKSRSQSYDFGSALHWCSQQYIIPVIEIARCLKKQQGSLLLKSYGELTHRLRPHYVPYVIVNGSIEKQNNPRFNLLEAICELLPPNTSHHCNY